MNCDTSELGFQTEGELPQLEPALRPRTDADEDIPSCRDNKYNSGYQKQAGSDTYFPSGEDSGYFDRPVTDSVTAQTERNTDFPSGKDSEFLTNRSRSRRWHGPEVIQTFPTERIQKILTDRSRSQ